VTTPPHSPGARWSRRHWLQAISASTALAGLGPAGALAQLRVEITGVGATQIPVALAPFRDEAVTGVALSEEVGIPSDFPMQQLVNAATVSSKMRRILEGNGSGVTA
jgi:hypothetical protein